MSIAKPRNRLVFFRVSEEEFQTLTDLCHSREGARSISQLARSAVHRLIADCTADKTGFITLEHLDRRLDDLQRQVQTLAAMLASDGHCDGNGANNGLTGRSHAVGREL